MGHITAPNTSAINQKTIHELPHSGPRFQWVPKGRRPCLVINTAKKVSNLPASCQAAWFIVKNIIKYLSTFQQNNLSELWIRNHKVKDSVSNRWKTFSFRLQFRASPNVVLACILHLLQWIVNSVVLFWKEQILLVHRMSLRGRHRCLYTLSGGKDLLMMSWESWSLSHILSATFSASVSPCVTLTPINNPNLSLSSHMEYIWVFCTSSHPVATFRCFYLPQSMLLLLCLLKHVQT